MSLWDYVGTLFNANPTPDTGLSGNHVPDMSQRALTYNSQENWWEATGLPLTPCNDDGSKNFYPMVNVTAKDNSGNVLATTEVVLPISDEMDCRACHSSTGDYNATMPSAEWENDADAEEDFKWNILRLHDEKFPTAVADRQTELQAAGYAGYDAGLYTTVKKPGSLCDLPRQQRLAGHRHRRYQAADGDVAGGARDPVRHEP